MHDIDGNQIRHNIKQIRQPHHDTLYCNQWHREAIVQSVDAKFFGADNVQILGLDIVTHDAIAYPIVCRRGDVFGIAKDFK